VLADRLHYNIRQRIPEFSIEGAVIMGLIIAFCVFGAAGAAAVSVTGQYFAQYPFLLAILYCLLLFLAGFLAAFLIFYFVQLVVSLFLPGDRSAEKPRPYCVWAMEQTAELICFFCGLRIHVTGEELLPADTRYLFVSNHRSNLDPIIVMNRLRKQQISFVSKPSNMKIPIVGRFIRQCCFPAHRPGERPQRRRHHQRGGGLPQKRHGFRGHISGGHPLQIHRHGRVPRRILQDRPEGQCANRRFAAVSGTEKAAKRALRGTDVYLDVIAVIPAEEAGAEKTVELAARVKEMLAERLAKRDK
jgi:1-acyl-sn-glycerol-3-phosphate acyltransferase